MAYGDFLRNSSKAYNSFTEPFNSGSISYSNNYASDSDHINQYRGAMQRSYQANIDKNTHRSLLDRSIDALQVGLYPTAGLVRGFTNDDTTPLEGFLGGLRAANPFGDGYTQGEHTYSRVLEDMGWEPTSTSGKIAKGALGFVGDVAFDPLTYLTGGISGVVKGTGKVMAGQSGRLSAMTKKQAEDIINKDIRTKNAGKPDSEQVTLTPEQLSADSDNLSKQYNKLTGMRQGDGLTFGLGNFPFADKIFGSKLGNARITLLDDDTLRKFGDDTIAPYYAKLRDSIYGGKIGELFSTKSAMYKAAKANPAKLYEFVKYDDLTKGRNLDKHTEENRIHDLVKTMNLTPAESKEIIEELQKPSNFVPIQKIIKAGETEKGKEMLHKMHNQRNLVNKELQEIDEILKNIEDVKRDNIGKLGQHKVTLDALEQDYRRRIINFDIKRLNTVKQLEDYNKLLTKEMDDIKPKGELSGFDLEKHLDDFKSVQKLRTGHFLKVDDLNSVISKIDANKLDELDPRVANELETRPFNAEDQVDYYTSLRATAEEELRLLKEETPSFDAAKMVDDFNDYLFGGEKVIAYGTRPDSLEDLLWLVRHGSDETELREFVKSSKNLPSYDGRSKMMYGYISGKLGYRDWNSKYVEPMKELRRIEQENGKLNSKQLSKYKQLTKLNQDRIKMIEQFRDVKSMDEMKARITKIENDEMYKELPESVRKGFYDEGDEARGRMTDEDYASRKEPDFEMYPKRSEFDDDTLGYDVQLTKGEQRSALVHAIKMFKWVDSKTGKPMKPNDKQKRIINALVKTYPDILTNTMKKEWSDLTPKDKEFLFSVANKRLRKVDPDMFHNAKRQDRLTKLGKPLDKAEFRQQYIRDMEMRKQEKGRIDFKNKVVSDVEGIKKDTKQKNAITESYENRKEALKSQIKKNEEEIKKLNKEGADERKELISDFVKQIDESKKIVDELSNDVDTLRYSEQGKTVDRLRLEKKAAEMDEVLANDEAMETYLRSKGVEGVTESAKIALDNRTDLNGKIKNIAKVLRAEFQKMGVDEVEIGKLSQDQLDAMFTTYVPRILTPEGAKFFRSQRGEQIMNNNPSLSKDLGYGVKFSPHQQSRRIKRLKINGKWVNNPNIDEVNEYFSQYLKGNNAFVDNISDIYITRAMKHTELMYDHRYMDEMLNVFGKDIPDSGVLEEGTSAIMNYGKLRDFLGKSASLQVSLEISAKLTEYLRAVAPSLRDMDEDVGKFIQDFMDTNYPSSEIQRLTGEYMDGVFTKTGIPKSVIEDMRVPMVQLDEAQVKLIKAHHKEVKQNYADLVTKRQTGFLKYGGDAERIRKSIEKLDTFDLQVKQVQDGIVQKANQSRKLQMAKDQSAMLRGFDKALHLIKLNMTTVMPAFHMRNKQSNMFLNWLATGRHAFDLNLQWKSFQIVKNQGRNKNIHDPVTVQQKDGTYRTYHNDELYTLAKQHNAIDEGFFAKDIGAESGIKGFFPISPKYDPTDTENFIPYKKGGEIGNLIENTDRMTHFIARLRMGDTPTEAALSSRTSLFDYSDLTAFEMSYMKRIFPFYTWLRKNSRYQISQLIDNPERYRYVAKMYTGVEGMTNEEDRIDSDDLPNFARGWVQSPFTSGDNPVMWNPNMPFNDLERIPDPFNPIESIKDLFSQTNPIAKVPIEQVANHNVFFEDKIVSEGESQLSERGKHILQQLAWANTARGFSTKYGDSLGYHALNSLAGVKFLPMDMDRYSREKGE